MALNRTINLLPEYFRTIPNQRFLNSTLDRIVSDPQLRSFDGYVGRKSETGIPFNGSYITEPSAVRSQYQLEPEFTFKTAGVLSRSAGFQDVLNSIASRSGVIDRWNRQLTGNQYTYRGFVDLDKLTNYSDYVWLSDPTVVNGALIDANPWFRTPILVSNSDIPNIATFTVTRTAGGLTVNGVNGINPTIKLARSANAANITNYSFEIKPNTVTPTTRAAKVVSQFSPISVIATNIADVYAESTISPVAKFVNGSGLSVLATKDFNFKRQGFTIESEVWLGAASITNDQVIISQGQYDTNKWAVVSWALVRTVNNTVKFVWTDNATGAIQEIESAAKFNITDWNHVAVCRLGDSVTIYLNSRKVGTTAIDSIFVSSLLLTLGTDVAGQLSLTGYLRDVRISLGISRYAGATYNRPTSPLQNDIYTVLMLHLKADDEQGVVYTDDVTNTSSKLWIQTHPGIYGDISSMPNISSRDILGVSNNGIDTGIITFAVPSMSDEARYRSLAVTGNPLYDFIDLATDLNFDQIDAATYSEFVQASAANQDSNITGNWGGIDGVTDLDGKTVVFIGRQQAGWNKIVAYENVGLEFDDFDQTVPVADEQKFGIWQIRVINNQIQLHFLRSIAEAFRTTILGGEQFRTTQWTKDAINNPLTKIPAMSSNYTTLYLQDDQDSNNVLEIQIINQNTALNVDNDIIGKQFYTSGTGVELINGLHVHFGSEAESSKYTQLTLAEQIQLIAPVAIIDTILYVDNTVHVKIGDQLNIDDEQMLVIAVETTSSSVVVNSIEQHGFKVNVVRGVNDTTVVYHPESTWIEVFSPISFIVEGVGDSIKLVPVSDLILAEPYLSVAQPADYITINRASVNQNAWSRSNRWFHRDVVDKMLYYHNIQFGEQLPYPSLQLAVRPVIEFIADLQLFDYNDTSLGAVTVLDNSIKDALSNIQGRRITDTKSLTLNNHVLVQGDRVIFNSDIDAAVRKNVYEVQYVDVDGDFTGASRFEVKVAATDDINLSSPTAIIDGVSLNNNDRVLIWKQNDPSQNGIYNYTIAGDFTASFVRSAGASLATDFANDFYIHILRGANANHWFKYIKTATTITIGVTALTFELAFNSGPIVNLVVADTAVNRSGVVILPRSVTDPDSDLGFPVDEDDIQSYQWYFNSDTGNWQICFASNQKNSVQQAPLFDVTDYQGNSFSDKTIYPSSSFAGSTLFEYARSITSAPDPVLGFGVTYQSINNIGDIVFNNTYESDIFTCKPDPTKNLLTQISINTGIAQKYNLLAGNYGNYDCWHQVLSNLELYQNILVSGQYQISITGQLLNKKLAQQHKIYLNGQQLTKDQYTVRQKTDQIVVTIDPSVTVTSDMPMLIKLIAATPLAGAWYDVPVQYENNPFNLRSSTFTVSDISYHVTAVNSNAADSANGVNYNIQNGAPGSIVLHEGFSVLPTILLTNPQFDIDQALKTAASDYEAFKLQFLKTSEQIEGIENLSASSAIDQIFTLMTVDKTSNMSWFTSDMVPVGGTPLTYIVNDVAQTVYDLSATYQHIASNKAVLVYVNGKQLIRGKEYTFSSDGPTIKITKALHIDDAIVINEFSNTDGCYVPSTPAKLGLAAAFEPLIYIDATYQTPTLVIQGHDGSITRAWNDYRDKIIYELELRIYNNIKVDSEYWNQVIQSRVPAAGKFRSMNGLGTYSMTEQATIQRKMFYEWVAENRVSFADSVYDNTNGFTYNYAGSQDKIDRSYLLGYWRGIYRDFYDTDRPNSRPWELLGLRIEPTWWKDVYGIAPYTGDNSILWTDLMNGYIRGENRYSVAGSRISNVQTFNNASLMSLLDVVPVDPSGNLKIPNDCVVAVFNQQVAKQPFTFNDGAPAETAWRRSSTYAFSCLRLQILQNPQFILGTLWDLDSYQAQRDNTSEPSTIGGAYDTFKYLVTQIPSISDVKLHSADTDANGNLIRRHSILNYSVEQLRSQGQDVTLLKQELATANVNLVYNLAGFADAQNLSVYAEQSSPNALSQTVQIPTEDYQLLLSESVPVGQVIYSGVIVSRSENGFRVTGYDNQHPFFVIQPSRSNSPATPLTVGGQTFSMYTEYLDNPIYIPYNTEFTSKQSVIDFLISYGEYLKRVGFLFDSQPELERIDWIDASVQFIKWASYNWNTQNINQLSLVLNPGASLIKFQPQIGTLSNLLSSTSLVLDDNQQRINNRSLDVFRDVDVTYINNQDAFGVISALRANLVNFEHKLVINNSTVFNDLIYNPKLGIRQNRVRLVGLKTGDWDGTLASSGFLLMLAEVPNWQPDTDYARGSIVKYKNKNYTALASIIGADKFQQNSFTISDTVFSNKLMPSIGAKALDLEHAYDLHYKNNINDMVRLRCSALGYVERTWLSNLGLDLGNQTEFYRGWIKEKGSAQAIQKFTAAGSAELLADFTYFEEYAFKVGEYGATGRTGGVDVLLSDSAIVSDPLGIVFESGESDSAIMRVPTSELYKKPINWNPNIVQLQNNLRDPEMAFQNAGPVLPQDIYAAAGLTSELTDDSIKSTLTFRNKYEMTTVSDTVNLIKNVRAGNWMWIATDPQITEQNQYNVITWINVNAKVKSIVKTSSTIDLYLDSTISVNLADVVAVDHQEAQAVISGIFKIADYRVINTTDAISILSLAVVDPSVYAFDTVTYSDSVALSSVFTYVSLRYHDLGSANLTQQKTESLMPRIKRAYVDYTNSGPAAYDFNEPYATSLITIPAPINILDSTAIDTTTGLAEDTINQLLWLGRASANRVLLRQFTGINFSTDQLQPVSVSIASYGAAKANTAALGTHVINLSNMTAAATATDSTNAGQVYILSYENYQQSISQILSNGGAGALFGQSLAASSNGEWLFVGAPKPSNVGHVFAYKKVTLDSVKPLETFTATGTSNSFALSYAPADIYSLKVSVNAELLIPDVDFAVSGSSIIITAMPALNDVVAVLQNKSYYSLAQIITDPDNVSGAQFGHAVSTNATASTLVVSAINNGPGKVYSFTHDVQKFIVSTATKNGIVLGSNYNQTPGVGIGISVLGLNPGGYSLDNANLISGAVLYDFEQQIGTEIEIDLQQFRWTQTIVGSSADLQYGKSLAISNNNLIIGSPNAIKTTPGYSIAQYGRVDLYTLDSEIQQSVLVPVADLVTFTNNNLKINNWLVDPGSNVETLINSINSSSANTGVTAALSADLNYVELKFNINLFTTGMYNISSATATLPALNSRWILTQQLDGETLNSRKFGSYLNWITDSILATTEQYYDFIETDQMTFDTNTRFDSESTNFYDSGASTLNRLLLLQLIQTKRTDRNELQDATQLTRVKAIQRENASADLFAIGDIKRLFVGDSAATNDIDNLQVYTNDSLYQGWTLLRSTPTKLDPHSIFRAWIYDSVNQVKLVDLDVVDLANGLLPSATVQHVDFISSSDPAVYGVPQWRSGVKYQVGQRAMYDMIVYTCTKQTSSQFFNPINWHVTSTAALNSGSRYWGSPQVGKIWFNTSGLRSVQYEQGKLSDRIVNYNRWFPDSPINIYEWVVSSTAPADTNAVLDTTTGLWYYWDLNKTEVGPIHPISANDISTALKTVPQSGLPMISPLTSNGVILYNVTNLMQAATNVLHIDYVTTEANNRIHSEYVLVSEDGSLSWKQTPVHTKMVDSLSGATAPNANTDVMLDVPDTNLNNEDRYGILNHPRQSLFRDRVKALDIYFTAINDELKKHVLLDQKLLSEISVRESPVTGSEYSFSVPDRATLLILDVNDYDPGTKVLVLSDEATVNSGWTLNQLTNNVWVNINSEFYDLSAYWQTTDWTAAGYSGQIPDYTIQDIGYLPSLTLISGNLIKILNNGNGKSAIYQVQTDLSLAPMQITGGTIQFLSGLYDFAEAGIGLGRSGFDSRLGFDSDPALPIRMIIESLNDHILVGDLAIVAEKAFFAIVRYILQESNGVEWLFRSSFISVKHRVKNLNLHTNYRQDDEAFVEDFINESKPYHTRVRSFVRSYDAADVASVAISDFDLPALYDAVWAKSQANGVQGRYLGYQAAHFNTGIALAEKDGLLYVGSDGIAKHAMGLWPNSTALAPTAQEWVFALNTVPVAKTTKYNVAVNGAIGVAVNGVPIYSVVAAETDTLVYNADNSIESTFTINIATSSNYVGPDASNGYLTPDGAYVYRMNPTLLYPITPTMHSPIIGFALDGYPIYGPYGFANSDGSGGIIQNTSSYALRGVPRLTQVSISNGTPFADYALPTGDYIEDYQYVNGLGTLDEHNGRYVITPEFKYGTYAYFITLDSRDKTTPVYPYVIGPTFQGVPSGLKFEYQGQSYVALYVNGNYTMPSTAVVGQTVSGIRTPSGEFGNDAVRVTEDVYSNWNNNHEMVIDSVQVANPGAGYSQAPFVQFNGGGGTGAAALAYIDGGSVVRIVLTNPGVGYTTVPTITLIGGILTETGSQIATAFPIAKNQTVRKIASTVAFDRITSEFDLYDGSARQWASGGVYTVGELIYTNFDDSGLYNYYKCVMATGPDADFPTDKFLLLVNTFFKNNETDRTTASGMDYAGVFVDGYKFVKSYDVVKQQALTAVDNDLDKVSLHLKFDQEHVFDNTYNFAQKINGEKSVNFSPYIQEPYLNFNADTKNVGPWIQFGSGSAQSGYLLDQSGFSNTDADFQNNLFKNRYLTTDKSSSFFDGTLNRVFGPVATNNDLFTLEFFIRMREQGRTQVLFDAREYDATTVTPKGKGLMIYANALNELCLTTGDLTFDQMAGNALVSGGYLALNSWQHVAVEFNNNNNQIALYLDGNRIGINTASGYSTTLLSWVSTTPTVRNTVSAYDVIFNVTPGAENNFELASRVTISGVQPAEYNTLGLITNIDTIAHQITITYSQNPGTFSALSNANITNAATFNGYSLTLGASCYTAFYNPDLAHSTENDFTHVANASMDELRLSVGVLRYNASTFVVSEAGWPRGYQDDPFFGFVTLLLGFETPYNEIIGTDTSKQNYIKMKGVGALQVIQDVSASSKILLNIYQDLSLGSGWTVSSPLTVPRMFVAGCGAQTTTLAFGGVYGSPLISSEAFNGTTWATGGDMLEPRYNFSGFGDQTAAVSVSGSNFMIPALSTSETYNGMVWTAAGNVNVSRYSTASAGAQTAGLTFGGYGSGHSAITEIFNGATWQVGNNLVTARGSLAGSGTQAAALSFGGYSSGGNESTTELYNGATWSTIGTLTEARIYLAGAGTSASTLSFGGNGITYNTGTTEEFDGALWHARNNMLVGRAYLGGGGSPAAGISFAGSSNSGPSSVTETYGAKVLTVKLSEITSPQVDFTPIPAIVMNKEKPAFIASSSQDYTIDVDDFTLEFWAQPGTDIDVSGNTLLVSTILTLNTIPATGVHGLRIVQEIVPSFGLTQSQTFKVYLIDYLLTEQLILESKPIDLSTGRPMIHNISIERYNQEMTLFVDGVMQQTIPAYYSFGKVGRQLADIIIGRRNSTDVNDFGSTLGDLRLTKGVARHHEDDKYDLIIAPTFESVTGDDTIDAIVDGSSFVNNIHCASTEEHANGRLSDNLSLTVITAVSDSKNIIFKLVIDALGNSNYYAVSDDFSNTLAQPMNMSDTTIYLHSIANMPDPLLFENTPGTVYVDAECMIYTGIDYATQSLTGVLRGLYGTAITYHAEDSNVIAVSTKQQLPGQPKVIGVKHTVQDTNYYGTTLIFESVDNINIGAVVSWPNMLAAGTNNQASTVINVMPSTLTVQVADSISAQAGTPFGFGQLLIDSAAPVASINTQSDEAHYTMWQGPGIKLVDSDLTVALFLQHHTASFGWNNRV